MQYTEDILKELIQRAVPYPCDNREIIDFIASFFQNNKFLIEAHPNPQNKNSNSLVIRTDMSEKPFMIFSGHLDVVPEDCDGDHSGHWCYNVIPNIEHETKSWSVPPKQITEKNGMLYGRGSSDMLGGVASLISSISHLNVDKLCTNIALILTDDEETEMKSADRVLEILYPKISDRGIIGCFVCEPTEMLPLIGQRGSCRGKISIAGTKSHIARPDLGTDAFYEANKAYHHLTTLCQRERKRCPEDGRFIPSDIYCRILDVKTDASFKRTIGSVTLNFMISHLPSHDIKAVIKGMKSYLGILDFKLKKYDPSFAARFVVDKEYPSFITDEKLQFIQDIKTVLETDVLRGAGFNSEAHAFSKRDIPTVILGPGSILQAHSKNEYIERGQLDKADLFWNKIFERYTAKERSRELTIQDISHSGGISR